MLHQDDIASISEAFLRIDKSKTLQLFQTYYKKHETGELCVLVADINNAAIGYLTIYWASPYQPFCRDGIPEIKDVNILPDYRRKGYGNLLLDHAESIISKRSKYAGIGVGLYSDYGPAQRIYARRGYMPDGNGLMYNNEQVKPGRQVIVDDDLTIMLIKKL